MKNILLTAILFLFVLNSLSQQRVTLPKEYLDIGVKVNIDQPNNPNKMFLKPPAELENMHNLTPDECEIGNTYYDRQTNRMLQGRLAKLCSPGNWWRNCGQS